jgi:hypothetical protein
MSISKYIFYPLIILVMILLIFGVFISRSDLQVRSDILRENHKKFFDYRGVTHAMSNYSQGSSPVAEMITQASNGQVDFLYITDFNDFAPEHEIFGYNQGVLVFTGKKISYLDAHLLLYSKDSLKNLDSIGTAQALTNDFLNHTPTDATPFTVVMAHPFKQGHEWTQPTYPEGLNGIEVMNLRHMWQQSWLKQKPTFIWSLFLYIFNPKIALLRLIDDPEKEIALWDTLNKSKKTLGFMGNHSTGKIFSFGPLSVSFPTYEDSFKFASNHVLLRSELTGIVSRDLEKMHNAMTAGNFYFAIDALSSPKGFAAYMRSGGRDFLMGDAVKLNKDLKLYVDLPPLSSKTFEVKLYRNGQEVKVSRDKNTAWNIDDPGFYRIYVRLRIQLPIPGELRWIPWIYTNNFYVK